jgi:hypothetical protein
MGVTSCAHRCGRAVVRNSKHVLGEKIKDFDSRPPLDRYFAAKLLRENAAHHLRKRFTGIYERESLCGVGPAEFEACGERGNPDLADGRVRADHETRLFRFLEQKIESAAVPFHFKIIFVAELLKTLAQSFERGVGAIAKFLIGHGLFGHFGLFSVQQGCWSAQVWARFSGGWISSR